MDPLFAVLLILILVFLEAIFVAAEIALVTVRRTRMEQLDDEGHRGARRVLRLIGQPGRFLAVIQIGITFVTLLAAAFAAESQTGGLKDLFGSIPLLAPYAEGLALVVVTAIVSLVTILFGELLPKTLALAHAERFAIFFARPVDLMGRLFRPLVWILTETTSAITRLLGVKEPNPSMISTEELKLLVERGGEQGILEAEEEQMISAVMELGESRIHEVMVPRTDIVAVPVTATFGDVVDAIIRDGHSRMPVFERSIDNIVGLLYAKDLLRYLKGTEEPPEIRTLLRPPLFVPESLSVDDLLHELQRRRVHIAIVLDEYGGTAGLVTIEDLLEEIVGEIQDEYDVEEPMVVRLSDEQARIDGRADVDELLELFDVALDMEDAEEYDTVGGLVYHHVGGIPHVGDRVELKGVTLTVESTDGRRVGKVLAVRTGRQLEPPADVDEA
jgi:putative hemolysin